LNTKKKKKKKKKKKVPGSFRLYISKKGLRSKCNRREKYYVDGGGGMDGWKSKDASRRG